VRPVAVELLAPAKINLTLHVVGRRPDGYHLLDSLVVFANVGDLVGVRPGSATTLTVTGPYADAVPTGHDNLVLRAARLAGATVEVSLKKALPVGAGIGGGSSDAAAVLRGIAALTGASSPDALPLGADVPVCVWALPARMGGIGERVEPLSPLPPLPLVLIHPGVALSTADVFAHLANTTGEPMPEVIPTWRDASEAAAWMADQRNDLEPAAIRLAPEIAEPRASLAGLRSCLLARMSGSGSTVFGLFANQNDARRAAEQLAAAHPAWWVRATQALALAPAIQERRLTT
jgi:4-diphosphocytidyl-2-C-methyl-D-erythritol kinase